MGESCTFIPRVKVNDKIESSKLFNEIRDVVKHNQKDNKSVYSTCREIYLRTKNPEFDKKYDLSYNDQNEPTIDSLLNIQEIKNLIGINNRGLYLKVENDNGFSENDKPVKYDFSRENYNQLLQNAFDFNNNKNNHDYIAQVVNDDGKLYIQVSQRSKDNYKNFMDSFYKNQLNIKLADILKNVGINIDLIEQGEYDSSVNGVTDFSSAKDIGNQIITMIKIANNVAGVNAISEEFSHIIIEAQINNPIIQRAISYLYNNIDAQKEYLGDNYDEYMKQYSMYDDPNYEMAKEITGKILADSLNKINLEQYKLPNIFQRLTNFIKQLFKGIKQEDVYSSMNNLTDSFNTLAMNILNGYNNIDQNSIKKIDNKNKYYQTVSDKIDKNKKILEQIKDTELKRYAMLIKEHAGYSEITKQQNIVSKIMNRLSSEQGLYGIHEYLDFGLWELKHLSDFMDNFDNFDQDQKFNQLREVNDFINSYKPIINNLIQTSIEYAQHEIKDFEENSNDEDLSELNINDLIKEISSLERRLERQFSMVAIPAFAQFLQPYMNGEIKIPSGKNAGQIIKIEELLRKAPNDINLINRWLDSMADSGDIILQLIDQATKDQKNKARFKALQAQKIVEAAVLKYRHDSGSNSLEWMFEKKSNGDKTGNYISRIDFGKYYDALNNYKEQLKKDYGADLSGAALIDYTNKVKLWINNNTEFVDGHRTPIALYENEFFKNGLTKEQKELYDVFMEQKSEMDALLPEEISRNNKCIVITKDLYDRARASKSFKQGIRQIGQAIQDEFLIRSKDTMYGDDDNLTDFEGNKFKTLPIYFTHLHKGESYNDLSTDLAATFDAYAYMATNYDAMSNIIDPIEIGSLILKKRKAVENQNGNAATEKIKQLGSIVEKEIFKSKGLGTNAYQRLQDFKDSQIYGKYLKDEGSFKVNGTNVDIPKSKLTSGLLKLSSMAQLGFNALAHVSNATTGACMQNIEAITGQFYNVKELAIADAQYFKLLMPFMTQLNDKVKTSKLALIDELFNVKLDFDSKSKNKKFNRSALLKIFGPMMAYLGQDIGDHWMYNRNAIAMLIREKVKDKNGNEVSLWDAFDIKPVKYGDLKYGGKLEIKDGYTQLNGKAINNQYIQNVANRIGDVNKHMFGIYNEDDMSAAKRVSIGRLMMQYRNWVVPMMNERFQGLHYNFDAGLWKEGYYRTSFKFTELLINDLKHGQIRFAANWKQLKPFEKQNITRAIVEIAQWIAFSALYGLVNWPDGKDRSYALKMAEYQSKRLTVELGVLIPGPDVTQGLQILKSPAAGINVIQNLIDMTKLCWPPNYFDEKQSGKYKGHSTAFKSFFDSPLIPYANTIYRSLNPDQSIDFLTKY